MWMDVIETLLLLGVVALLGYAAWNVRFNLLPYLENLRRILLTKDDLITITETIERLPQSIRLEPVIPELPSPPEPNLASQGYEHVYENLSELWDVLLRLQRSARDLGMDEKGEGKKESQSTRESQLYKFAENFNLLSELVYTKRPFYPQPIYECLVRIMALADREASGHPDRYLAATTQQQIVSYWESVGKNQDEISVQIDQIAELIRQRLAT